MGKMLIDKLLRTCPGIENIYLLVRPKKGKDIHTRLDEIFDDLVIIIESGLSSYRFSKFSFYFLKVFERLREEVPKFRHKIVAMNGDCALTGLGLSLIDRQTLISNVQLVFHAAATVRFDEKLKLAVSINVCGTQEVLELCSHMTKLEVHRIEHRSNNAKLQNVLFSVSIIGCNARVNSLFKLSLTIH